MLRMKGEGMHVRMVGRETVMVAVMVIFMVAVTVAVRGSSNNKSLLF